MMTTLAWVLWPIETIPKNDPQCGEAPFGRGRPLPRSGRSAGLNLRNPASYARYADRKTTADEPRRPLARFPLGRLAREAAGEPQCGRLGTPTASRGTIVARSRATMFRAAADGSKNWAGIRPWRP